jgi:hypothetical protein
MSVDQAFEPLNTQQLHDLRYRILKGEEVTPDEVGLAVRSLQLSRNNAGKRGVAKKTTAKKAKAPVPSLDDLL